MSSYIYWDLVVFLCTATHLRTPSQCHDRTLNVPVQLKMVTVTGEMLLQAKGNQLVARLKVPFPPYLLQPAPQTSRATMTEHQCAGYSG